MMKIPHFLLFFLHPLLSLSQCENDTINPWFSNFQEELTISCSTDLSEIFPQAFDDCDTLVDIAYYDEVFPGPCPGAMDIVRIYRAYDDSGNQKVEMQSIHVVDEIPPVFSEMINYTVSCTDSVGFTVPVAVDNCSQVSLSYEDYFESEGNCERTLIRLWTAVDACGNSTSVAQTITFTDDQAPSISGEIYIELQDASGLDSIHVTTLDNCSIYSITYEDVEVSGGNVLRTYTATDECGNYSTFLQILHVPMSFFHEASKMVTMCRCVGNDNWVTVHVVSTEVQHLLTLGSYMGKCIVKGHQNEIVPMRMNLEITEEGHIRKSLDR